SVHIWLTLASAEPPGAVAVETTPGAVSPVGVSQLVVSTSGVPSPFVSSEVVPHGGRSTYVTSKESTQTVFANSGGAPSNGGLSGHPIEWSVSHDSVIALQSPSLRSRRRTDRARSFARRRRMPASKRTPAPRPIVALGSGTAFEYATSVPDNAALKATGTAPP